MDSDTERTNSPTGGYTTMDRASTQPSENAWQVHGHSTAWTSNHTGGWIPRRTPGDPEPEWFPTNHRAQITNQRTCLAMPRRHSPPKSYQSITRPESTLLLARHVSSCRMDLHGVSNVSNGLSSPQTSQNHVRRACPPINSHATTGLRHRLLRRFQG